MNRSASGTILCFGDSNTYGQRSDDVTKGRWPKDVRWTGRLQGILGDRYNVIEDGRSGRTTDIDDSHAAGLNGRAALAARLAQQTSIDIVVLMLGTNDIKMQFRRSAHDVALAVGGLTDDIRVFARDNKRAAPEIIIVSPIHLDISASHFAALYHDNYNIYSEKQSKDFAVQLQKIAAAKSCGFLDAATVARSGDDGVHFDKTSHAAFAQELADYITQRV